MTIPAASCSVSCYLLRLTGDGIDNRYVMCQTKAETVPVNRVSLISSIFGMNGIHSSQATFEVMFLVFWTRMPMRGQKSSAWNTVHIRPQLWLTVVLCHHFHECRRNERLLTHRKEVTLQEHAINTFIGRNVIWHLYGYSTVGQKVGKRKLETGQDQSAISEPMIGYLCLMYP